MKKKMIWILTIVIPLIIFLYFENNALVTTHYTVSSEKLPSQFEGYRIIHLSDLHSKQFGENQLRLVEKVAIEKPDAIFFTGDLVDRSKTGEKHWQRSLTLMEQLVKIAPVYYVSGNHEWDNWNFLFMASELTESGIRVLRNESELIERDNEQIAIAGIDDLLSAGKYSRSTVEITLNEALGSKPEDVFTLLLAHRPKFFDAYEQHGADITFSGHAHGGQFRLPFIGGLIAPGQGLFPKYDSGLYKKKDSVMVVNRGLGNSRLPQRLFNRPEVVVVTLATE